MRYAIYAPPYSNSSAGVRVLHRLCHFLNTLGEEAYVTTDQSHPHWNTPFTDVVTPDTVVVYPEIVAGNPLGGARVVRYCLNAPALIGGEIKFADSEMVFYYEKRYHDQARAATNDRDFSTDRLVRIAVIEPEIFYPDKSIKRDLNCFYVGKARLRAGNYFKLQDESQFVPITWDSPNSRRSLATLLRRCQVLVSYDDATSLLMEALICGTEARVIDQTKGNMYVYTYDTSEYATRYYDVEPVVRFRDLTRQRWP